jgi:hypothetical protein
VRRLARHCRGKGSPIDRFSVQRTAAGTIEMDSAATGGQAGRFEGGGIDLRPNSAKNAEKNELKPHLRQCWVIPPEQNADFVMHMEDVLEVYQRPYDRKIPVVCMDEQPTQLIRETRRAIPA